MCAVVFLTLTLSRRSLESLVLLLGGAPQSISMDQCRASAVDLAARGSTGLDRPPELTPGRGGPRRIVRVTRLRGVPVSAFGPSRSRPVP